MKNYSVIIIVVISLFFGVMFGLYIGAMALFNDSSTCNGWEDAKEKLSRTGHYKDYANSFSGKVVKVDGNKVTFETKLINPLDDESLKIRTVVIDDQTKLTLKVLKTEEEYEKDRKEFKEKNNILRMNLDNIRIKMKDCDIDENETCDSYNKEYSDIKKEISNIDKVGDKYKIVDGAKVSDIKSGNSINVISKIIGNDIKGEKENVLDKKEFTASVVEVFEKE